MITVGEVDKVDKGKIETDKMEKWGKVGKSKWPQLHERTDVPISG